MPLVQPLAADHDPEVAMLALFFNRTLGFAPNSVLTMMRRPAIARAFTELNDFARAAASVPTDVTEAVVTALHEHWDDGEIVEITGVIALFGFLNRWNDSMATELEDPAAADGTRWLAGRGWIAGKHAT